MGTNLFTHKKIDVTFTKGTGVFAESGTNAVKLSGLRVSAMITKAGGAFQGAVDMSVTIIRLRTSGRTLLVPSLWN